MPTIDPVIKDIGIVTEEDEAESRFAFELGVFTNMLSLEALVLSVKVKEEDGGSDCEFCWAEATEVKWRVRDDENGVRNLGVLHLSQFLALNGLK